MRLANDSSTIRYTGRVPNTRWGAAIALLLAERGWTQRHLANAAKIRPNTLTNLIKHGRDTDTGTLIRVAGALGVDVAELFLTREQIEILRTYREHRVERLKQAVLKEVSELVTRHVHRELERVERAGASKSAKKQARS